MPSQPSSVENPGSMAQVPPSAGLPEAFQMAMRNLAATLTLVTTCEDGRRHGMPATAVSSLSMDPPSLLVCINRSASMHGPTLRCGRFCVNLLAADQALMCNAFGSRAGSDRFQVGDWADGPCDLPYLSGSVAALFCSVEHRFDYGTHTVLVGRVDQTILQPGAEPLLYLDRKMGCFSCLETAQ